MIEKSFTTFDASRILGIKYQRLREWIGRGQVKPSIVKAEGIGTKTLFSRRDLYLIALFRLLVEKGFSRDDASSAVKDLNSYLSAAKTWDDPAENSHLLFFEDRDRQGKNMPRTYILNDQRFKEMSLYELLSHKGYFKDALEYDKFVMVNFRKIRGEIDMAVD